MTHADDNRCPNCRRVFRARFYFNRHVANCRRTQPRRIDLPELPPRHNARIRSEVYQSALRGCCKSVRFTRTAQSSAMLPNEFFAEARPLISNWTNSLGEQASEYKVQPVLCVRAIKVNGAGETTHEDKPIFSARALSLIESDIDDVVANLLSKVEAFIRNGSNWVVDDVLYFDLRITKFHSAPNVRGHGAFPLPQRLAQKHAVVNVDNLGAADCFKYAILSVLHYDDVPIHRQRKAKYQPWENELHLDGITWPMTAIQLDRFHRQNPTLMVNILQWVDDNVDNSVQSLCQPRGSLIGKRLVNVLVVDPPSGHGHSHFVGVIFLDRLLNKHANETSHRTRAFHCERCLQPFRSKDSLEAHRPGCYEDRRETLLPPKTLVHRFDNWGRTQAPPYILYADIECILVPGDVATGHLQRHEPVAFGCLLVPNPNIPASAQPLQLGYKVWCGPNCMDEAMAGLAEIVKAVDRWNQTYVDQPIRMTQQDWVQFRSATVCYACGRAFGEGAASKVKDHCHLNGRFRGAACSDCNGKLKMKKKFLPIVFHNLRNYDMHVLCATALGKMKDWNLTVIPQTTERYLSLTAQIPSGFTQKTKRQRFFSLRFIDSYQFLQSSLANLVSNLSLGKLKLCSSLGWPQDLIQAKGVFPYSWLNSIERLDANALPEIEACFDPFSDSNVSGEDYARAQSAWDALQCTTMRDYTLAYLRLDVHQLADVFEEFRSVAMKDDGLDPAHYLTAPGLSWDAAFLSTGAEVDLISDPTMFQFFESGIRGGMVFVNQHRIVANTPRVPEMFNPEEAFCDLLYVDANNLYGQALSMPLPQKEFRWMEQAELDHFDVLSYNVDGPEGCVLEVDMDYPPEVQDRTCDLPLAPERMTTHTSMLTPHMQAQWRHLQELRGHKLENAYRGTQKLMLTHFSKEKYVVHIRVLQLYVQLGLHITKIHRGVVFKQAPFFKSYIDGNSAKRQAAANDFEKDYYKLKNNSLFGKTMENIRNRMDFRLCQTEQRLTMYSSRPSFAGSIIFNENLVGVHVQKETIEMCKPLYIGQAVLDISKWVMYHLRYCRLPQIEAECGVRFRAVGGDTDSFFLAVEAEAGLHSRDMVQQAVLPAMVSHSLLDTSNYPHDHLLFSNRFKARLGCIKDESGGEAFREWIFLRPKCYSLLTVGGDAKKRAKGVRRNVVERQITHADYRHAWENEVELYANQRRIASELHQLYTLQYRKRTLSYFEDKRAWISVNKSLPYGNHSLPNTQRPPKLQFVAPQVLGQLLGGDGDPQAPEGHDQLG